MSPIRNQRFLTSITKRHAHTYHSTPHRHKVASDPLYRMKGHNRLNMAALMKRELRDAYLNGVPLFIDHLFPDHFLPFDINQELLGQLTNNNQPLYNKQCGVWVDCPNLSHKTEERHMANWLNLVCTRLSQSDTSKTLVPKRIWSSHFATKPLGGCATKRKPDIILVNNFAQNGWVWQDVHSLIEMTVSEPKGADKTAITPSIKKTLGDKAFLMFEAQQNRRYVLVAALIKTLLHIHLYDRAGVVRMVAIDIHQRPLQFLRFLAGIVFTDSDLIGYDPTIHFLPDGSMTVTVENTYAIKETLCASGMIRGRATICWRTERDGCYYAIKDSWVDSGRDTTEIQFLEKAEKCGIEGVPRVVESKDMMVHGVKDTTDSHRPMFSRDNPSNTVFKNLENRIHRRLVLTPCAIPITHFTSKRELISVLIDIVETHKKLLDKAKILHRDISVNNVMINTLAKAQIQAAQPSTLKHSYPTRSKNQSARIPLPIRKGLLVDFDYATFYEAGTNRKVYKGHRTGTVPFMAREILRDGSKAENRPTHDLESLFYVLLWICSNYCGPNNAVREDAKRKDMPIMMWVDTILSLDQISNTKAGHISSDEYFTKRILDHYAPYFEDLKACSNELRCLFTVSDADVTHDAVLLILRRTLRNLHPEYDLEDHTIDDKEDIELEDEDDEDEKQAEEEMEEEEEEEEEEDIDDDMAVAQSGLGLNLRPLQFLPYTTVTRVPPRAAMTTYPIGRARSSSPCPQYTPHAHPQ